MKPEDTHIQALTDLGFTPVEAEVYLFLLAESPASGYRVAQALGRPAAQVYKAVEALQQKGAVIAEEGKTKRCRAVPAVELLKHLETRFRRRKEKAGALLKEMARVEADHRVYQLKTVEQVYSHAASMLERAERVVLLDLFPKPLSQLRDQIEDAAGRGVIVGLKTYEPCQISCTEKVTAYNAAKTLERWPGQHLSLVIDGHEFLSAMLYEDELGLHHAIWSRSTYLSSLQHNGIGLELSYTRLTSEIKAGASLEDLHRSIVDLEQFYLSNCTDAPDLLRQELGVLS